VPRAAERDETEPCDWRLSLSQVTAVFVA